MLIKGLDRLLLEVNNLDETLVFYKAVGFVVESHQPQAEPPMATLRTEAVKLTLVQQPETMLRRGRGVHFFLTVDDVDAFYEMLQENFADVQPPVDEGWGGRFVTLQDPDKYRFFFVTWSDSSGRADVSRDSE